LRSTINDKVHIWHLWYKGYLHVLECLVSTRAGCDATMSLFLVKENTRATSNSILHEEAHF
jgi:hypothetical protein